MLVITKKDMSLVMSSRTSLEDIGAVQRAILGLLRNQKEAPDPEDLAAIADLLEATLLTNDQWYLLEQASKKAA